MNSIRFPRIFEGNSTKVVTGIEATKNCLNLLIGANDGQLLGDPEFVNKLKRYTFEQNNYVLKSVIIDVIYSQICIFCPQLIVNRKDIEVTQSGKTLYATVIAKNKSDFATNTYNLVMFEEGD